MLRRRATARTSDNATGTHRLAFARSTRVPASAPSRSAALARTKDFTSATAGKSFDHVCGNRAEIDGAQAKPLGPRLAVLQPGLFHPPPMLSEQISAVRARRRLAIVTENGPRLALVLSLVDLFLTALFAEMAAGKHGPLGYGPRGAPGLVGRRADGQLARADHGGRKGPVATDPLPARPSVRPN